MNTYKIAIIHEDGRKFFMEDGDGRDDIFESMIIASKTIEYYFGKYDIKEQSMAIVPSSTKLEDMQGAAL